MVRVSGKAEAPTGLDLAEPSGEIVDGLHESPVFSRCPYFPLSESLVAVLSVSGLLRGKYAPNRVNALTALRRALPERRPACHR